jgi:hypothetical protein
VPAFGLIFVVVGAVLGVGALFALVRTRRFLAQAYEAAAEVVGLQQRLGTNQERAYYPVLRYRTQGGTTHEVVSSVGSNPPRYQEGDRLSVLYDPENPENMRIHSFLNVWAFPLILGVTCVIFLGVGAGLTLFSGR